MKKVLITGFEPFGGASINPALEAVKALDGLKLEGGVIVTCQVPVTRYESIRAIVDAIETHQPSIVITVGQAAGRASMSPERIAINMDDFRIPDNGGNQPIDLVIDEDGPAAYFTSLPIKAITQAMQDRGIPCQVSNTAGTFVCNHVFYGIQHFLRDTDIAHGFIHIPLLPVQAAGTDQPSMSLENIIEGLKIAAQVTLTSRADVKIGAGQIC